VAGVVVQTHERAGRDGDVQRDALAVPGGQRGAVEGRLPVQDAGEDVGERVRAALVDRAGVPVDRRVTGQGVHGGERRGRVLGGQVGAEERHPVLGEPHRDPPVRPLLHALLLGG
jgi:hypothetical protein